MAARERVTPNDAVWLQDTATNRMVIHGIYTTDHIGLAEAREIFRTRVLEADGGRRYPRFHKRVLRAGGRWYWEDDPAFDITRHMVPSPLAGPTSAARLQDYIATVAHEPLPDDRPLWRIEYLEDFEDGQSAFFVRVHHALADGIAFVPVILALMDGREEIEAPSTVSTRPAAWLRSALLAPLAMPLVLAERALWRPDRHALHGRPVGGHKRVTWTKPFALLHVKRFKDRFGATVNDVLMALVSGAIARYLETSAGQQVRHLRLSMPVNMRVPGEPLRMENRFAAVPLSLPALPRELPHRLAAVKARLDALKHGLDPLAIYDAVNVLLTALPYGVSRRLLDFFANKCTGVVTNVPGPQMPLSLGGRRLRSLMFWVPQRADIGLGISILTFAGQVQVGVIADTGILDDPAPLAQAIEREFDQLLEYVGGLVPAPA